MSLTSSETRPDRITQPETVRTEPVGIDPELRNQHGLRRMPDHLYLTVPLNLGTLQSPVMQGMVVRISEEL